MHNTKMAPSSFATTGSAGAALETTNPGKADSPEWFDELTETRVTMLRKLATVAAAVAKHHLSNDSFHRLVKFAYDQKIITADRLKEMGRSDRTTASRWINGHNAPNPFAQEAILNGIAAEAEEQARRLRAGQPSSDADP
jgi:hypothetical protein